jgi:AGZA family xanthine/uracil permease-like MFS transporter
MTRYAWAKWGDVNGFFGLMLDNVSVMLILTATLCHAFPADQSFTQEFVVTRMIPGSALGVLIGDLVYTWMAFRLARRLRRTDVTAMPLGLDTPSTFAVAFLVLLPALKQAKKDFPDDPQRAMEFAWHVGAVILVLIGVFKTLAAPLGNKVRQWVPRAGLLGSLAAIALCLIAFLPLVSEIATAPLVGLLALTVILVTLVAHRPLPGNVPGALAAVVIGIGVYYLCRVLEPSLGPLVPHPKPSPLRLQEPAQLIPSLHWALVWDAVLAKLPIMIPFALATIVGGIDCTESAAAAGDEYDTRTILLTEGLASVAAGLCGGVLQNTPYIGHPAYKAMGSRAAYTLATGLFVGAAGYLGWFLVLFNWLPEAAMFPILVFVGLEITAQSFRATPVRHYAALAFAILPALAGLGTILLDQTLGTTREAISPKGADVAQTLRCLSNGFIVSSLLWGAALAALLDRRLRLCATYLAVAGVFSLFGIIHSPLVEAPIALPADVMKQLAGKAALQTPYHWAASYAIAAAFVLILDFLPVRDTGLPHDDPAPDDLGRSTGRSKA